ncbi:MAG: ABC transporter ATP-binding protein/permease [Defluviitaleaceae bacterium]|nr:ABC transporter ATP-binding protein/permease [Defluviitaleaceae bacterium]
MSKLIKYLKPYWWAILLTLVFLMLEVLAGLYLPTLMATIIDNGIIRGVVENTPQTAYILQTGVVMLGVALMGGAASVGTGYLAPRISAGAARDLRKDLFIKVESFSQMEFDTFSASSLITRCTNDVTQVQQLANMATRMLFFAPIMGAGAVIMALNQSVAMSWIIVLAVIVLLGFVFAIVPTVMPRFRIMQGMIDKLNKIARETLHGLMVIRAFGTQQHEKERFDESNKEIFDISLFVSRVMAVVFPAMSLILGGTQLLVVWVGAQHIAAADLQIGDMMAFMQYSVSVIFAFMMLSMVIIMIPRALVSAGRISEVLATEPVIQDPDKNSIKEFDTATNGVVVFDNVSFRYPKAEVDAVSNINFTASPGKMTAIIGPTGVGKSTIAHLLLRFYDVTTGSILMDGVDVRNTTQAEWRKKIGYVPQKGQLIAGTIEYNIRYGNPQATEEEVAKAAEIAQAMPFIQENAEGMQTEIGQKGGTVSGGQRQRLSIARALATNPQILIFDDSFSALDYKTDAELRRALKENVGNATVIIIAQRVGTIRNADQIIVLDEGTIVGKGTHAELLETCSAYYEIALSQDAL